MSLFSWLSSPFSWLFSPRIEGNKDMVIPSQVKEICKHSLYELYSPPNELLAEVDIVFFHGLSLGDYKDAYWQTWSSDNETVWQRTLLGKSLPKARVLSVSYDSALIKAGDKGYGDLYLVAENLMQDIVLNESASVGRGRPVILVGHSLGGLLIKQFIMHVHFKKTITADRAKEDVLDNFLKNFCGVFYYGTPHQGSPLATIAENLPVQTNNKILEFLKVLSEKTSRLNEDFHQWRSRYKVGTATIAESLNTDIKRFGFTAWVAQKVFGSDLFLVVPEASVRFDSDRYYTAHKDHLDVCKHTDFTESAYMSLVRFVTDSTKNKVTLTEGRLDEVLT